MTTTAIILVMRCRPGVLQRAVAESDEMQQFEDVTAAARLDPKVLDRARDAPQPPLPPSRTTPAGCSQTPRRAPAAAARHPRREGDPNQAAAASDLRTPEEVRRRRATGPSPSDVAGGGGGRGCTGSRGEIGMWPPGAARRRPHGVGRRSRGREVGLVPFDPMQMQFCCNPYW